MRAFKKPWHEKLFASFACGQGTREAAREAGVSEPTARKFRKDWGDDIREAQAKSTTGVLQRLKEMLPLAVDRQAALLSPPPPFDAPEPPKPPPWWTAKTVDQELRIIRSVFDSFEAMRDVEFETRLKTLERRLAELTKSPDEAQAKPAAAEPS